MITITLTGCRSVCGCSSRGVSVSLVPIAVPLSSMFGDCVRMLLLQPPILLSNSWWRERRKYNIIRILHARPIHMVPDNQWTTSVLSSTQIHNYTTSNIALTRTQTEHGQLNKMCRTTHYHRLQSNTAPAVVC